MDQVRRAGGYIGRFLATDVISRSLSFAVLAVFGGTAVVIPDTRQITVGVAASAAVLVVARFIRRYYNLRIDAYLITKHETSFTLKDHGRQVEFKQCWGLKSRSRDLRFVDFRLVWSGETELATLADVHCEVIGDDVTLERIVESRFNRLTGYVIFRFTFKEPLRLWKKRKFGVNLLLNEPLRTYLPSMTYDSGQSNYSYFTQFFWEVAWDNTHPVVAHEITASEYRHQQDYYLSKRKPLARWTYEKLRVSGDLRRVRLRCWPSTPATFYAIEFPLRPLIPER